MPVLSCDRCGAPLPEDARFCPRCGAPVAVAVTSERKVVTVLFADLAASTELAARLDPERFREVMAAFFQMVSEELESLRGRAEKFIGDAVMAVFGLPHAHDDDALRAVRAGLVIRDRTMRLGEELGLPSPLEVRVGVNSGPVATGSGPSDQLLVSGVAVNLASRLQEAAEPGEVLVGDTTWQLTRDVVEFGPPRPIEARGFDGDVHGYPVTALSGRSTRRTIPLVDRRREVALLQDAFERVRETSRPHLVTLLGEAGIGKSRLVEELLASLPDEARVLHGRANVFEEDVTFAPLADMIRRQLNVEADTHPEEIKARLEELVKGCCEPDRSEQIAARLGLALGLGSDEQRGEGRSYRAAEIRAGFLELLQGLGMLGPVVVLFEDLHLARPGLLELIEEVVAGAKRIPLLMLAVGRGWLLEEHPDWGSSVGDAVRIQLEPLRFEQAKELAQVAGASIDDPTAERIALHAGGNPFFIIETTGMLMQEHEEHLSDIPHSHLLPPTVQAVIASRIDHLDQPAKDLFRKASVFPRSTFHVSDLAMIAEADEDILRRLEEDELLVHDAERPGLWRFRHGMLRDVAYESLPKRERLRLHLQVAKGLARDGEDRHPNALAYHLEQAARASLDLDPADRSLAERAVEALARAADRARRAMESPTAIDHYTRALELSGPESKWGMAQARVLSGLGESHYWLAEFEDAEAALERALSIGDGDDWTETHGNRFLADIVLNIEGDQDRASKLFDDALAAARRLGDDFAMARTLLMAGWAPFWRDDLDGARAMFEEALAIARANPEGDRWAEARALTSLASVITPVGDEREALALAEQALDIGTRMEDRFTVAVAQGYAAGSLRRMARLDEAMPLEDEAVRTFRDLGARWELASTQGDRGSIHRLAGRLDQAEADLREALKLCKRLGDRTLVEWTAGELSRTLLATGDVEGARQALDQPMAEIADEQPSMRTAEALIERHLGNVDRATEIARALLENEAIEPNVNYVASRRWWVGRLFGGDAAGGADAVEEARRTLERANWLQAIREPDLWAEPVRTDA
ncbi:MAG TPA: tetratricopeptide repeat protein [Actinomycetota bacterium]|nr:tetratricopeptide repeat protein [Actinomycetota bacterium]